MTATGPIAWRARSEIPATWDALAQASTFGDLSLQIKLDYIKYSLFGTVVDQATEIAMYNPITLAYAGKMLALQVIPGGMDYWTDQSITFTGAARQSSESVGYPDRVKNLQVVYARLVEETEKLAGVVIGVNGVVAGSRRMLMPRSSEYGKPYRTPDPHTFTQWAEPTTFTNYPFSVIAP